MITIDRMEIDYRLSGPPSQRASLARRLDRLATGELREALEEVAQDFAREDGPLWVVRRLDLALWLDPSGLPGPAIARLWAEALGRALFRRIAEGGTEVAILYPDRAAYLAAWASDLVAGRAEGAWQYQTFRALDGLPPGRALAAALGHEPLWVGPTFQALAAAQRLPQVLAALTAEDVRSIWTAWCGGPPVAGPPRPELIARLSSVAAPEADPARPEGRARAALGWLVELCGPPLRVRPEVAGPLALQLSYGWALAALVPGLAEGLLRGASRGDLLRVLDDSPPALGSAASWARAALEVGRGASLAKLAELTGGSRAGRTRAALFLSSRYAGCVLLLPAIRDLGLVPRLGAAGLHLLLVQAVPLRGRALALGDSGLQRLAALPDDAPAVEPAMIDWPEAESLGIGPEQLARDAPTHGDGPAAATLRAVLDRFAEGLRGMPGSSAGYLWSGLLDAGGRIEMGRDRLLARLDPVPLRILLSMGARLGRQGPVPWLGGRELVMEMADG